jgi:enoyl-CoA hydratase
MPQVNHVVPLDDLEGFCMRMAAKIASKPMFALQMAKEVIPIIFIL